MLRYIVLGCLGSALVLCGCAGEKLSVGEVRCEGEDVRCERPEALKIAPWVEDEDGKERLVHRTFEDGGAPSATEEESPVEATWMAGLPCPNQKCAVRGTYVVMHPDGALTVARLIRPSTLSSADAGPLYAGVWLGHFDADGELLWQDDSLLHHTGEQAEVEHAEVDVGVSSGGLGEFDAALALDQHGHALLGVLRDRVSRDEQGHYSQDLNTSVYRVSDAGEVKRLFQTDDLAELSAIAEVDGDVLLLSGVGDSISGRFSELSRYEPNGGLVWRQTALRAEDYGQYVETLDMIDMPMVTDAQGRATLATPGPITSGPLGQVYETVQVGPDGNIRWVAGDFDVSRFSEPSNEWGAPRLARDTVGRLVLAQSAYVVTRFEQHGATVLHAASEEQRSPVLAARTRDGYWKPLVMGLACDASDRVLVVTQSGAKAARRLLIDRISADFSERETFALPLSFALSSDLPDQAFGDPYEMLSNTGGIAAGPDGTVIAWTNSAIARFALPE